jgi:hypothetical protein
LDLDIPSTLRQIIGLRKDIWKEITKLLDLSVVELRLKRYGLSELNGIEKIKTSHLIEMLYLWKDNNIISDHESLVKLQEVLMVLFGISGDKMRKALYDRKDLENPVANIERMVEATIARVNSKTRQRNPIVRESINRINAAIIVSNIS